MVGTMNPLSRGDGVFMAQSEARGRSNPELHEANHEPFMVPTMNPLTWSFVGPPIVRRPELVVCPAAKISRFSFHHEGNHEGFHYGPPSSWRPWTPPRSDISEANGLPLGPLPNRAPPVIAWLSANR